MCVDGNVCPIEVQKNIVFEYAVNVANEKREVLVEKRRTHVQCS